MVSSKSVFETVAVKKWTDNKKSDLTFPDACGFWDISQNLKGEVVSKHLSHVVKLLNELYEKDLAQQDGQLNNGRVVTRADIRNLHHLHNYMEDRFERLLGLLRKR